MKVVFFGTPDWAVPSLVALMGSEHRPSLVVTQPARRRGRAGAASPSPVAGTAARLGLPILEPESIRKTPFPEAMEREAADLFVVVAYGRIFPERLLAIPPRGAINVHFSLLPAYRGAAPVQWAIAEGETRTGATTMGMVKDLDAGPIYLQGEVAIERGEHAPSLGARLAEIGARLLVDTLDGIAAGRLEPREQDGARASLARLLTAEDGWIDWREPAWRIEQRIRGFDPWPGQSARSERGKLRVLEARAGGDRGPQRAEGGSVLGEGEGGAVRIACAGGTWLDATTVQPEARRPMGGAEALRGRHLRLGERLG
jgi:methionyl-tRNA formyltransferase